jgi:hypothetical protein
MLGSVIFGAPVTSRSRTFSSFAASFSCETESLVRLEECAAMPETAAGRSEGRPRRGYQPALRRCGSRSSVRSCHAYHTWRAA